jgi:tetratricopeptide (TPR) repeat protein
MSSLSSQNVLCLYQGLEWMVSLAIIRAAGGAMLLFRRGHPVLVAIVIVLVLSCCVDCCAQSAIPETSSAPILPANTPVILRLTETVYKRDAKPGHPVEFEVGDDVIVNDQIFIQSGTPVHGSVRQVEHTDKGRARVLIDLGPALTVSGETAQLAWAQPSLSSNGSGVADVVGMGALAGPFLPALVIPFLFEKKVLLDNAWGGVWVLARATEKVALDAEKQKAAQEQYTAGRKAAQAELCGPQPAPAFQNWESLEALVRRSGLGDSRKANLLHQAGDLDGAIGAYEQMLASSANFPCSSESPLLSILPSSASLHFEIAGLFREKGDFARAVTECRTAVQLDPKDGRFRIGLANTLEDSGDLDAALAVIKNAIQTEPDESYLHYLLGRVLVKKNEVDAAVVELQRALKESRNHFSPANCELGRAFELKGDLRSALQQYRTAFRAHVNDERCRAAYERLKLQPKK